MKDIINRVFPFFVVLFVGCATLDQTATLSSIRTVEKATPIVQKAGEAVRPMTEEEEYYLRRAVAALVLSKYQLYNNFQIQSYLNLVGQTVVLSSDRPYTHGGYHFAVLDTEEVNAFACPGGIIFITKGMLKSLNNEEELAAVLAHEVAHVSLRHGISAIKASRWADVVLAMGTEAAKSYTSAEVNKLVSLFEGSIDDVFKTIVVNGYGKDQEVEADGKGIIYVNKAGFDPKGLPVFLDRLIALNKGSKDGMFKTHPGTKERSEKAKEIIKEMGLKNVESSNRTNRFKSFVQNL